MSKPTRLLNSSAARWVGAPTPDEPYCSLPELALQKANSSAGVRGGSLGLSTITTSLVATRLIGMKSATGS